MRFITQKTLRQKITLFGVGAFMAMAPSVSGQVSSYVFSQSSGTYSPITGGAVIVANTVASPIGDDSAAIDDFAYTPTTIPFPFSFNGIAYTSFRTESNGYIYFGTGAVTGSVPISGSDAYGGAVSAFGLDLMGPQAATGDVASGSTTISNVNTTNCVVGAAILGTGIPTGATIASFTTNSITLSAAATSTGTGRFITWTSGEIRVETIGIAPNRICVVQFKNMARYSNSATSGANTTGINFQIRLNEAGGVIANQTVSVVYGAFNTTVTTAATPQVGLRGSSNADFNNRITTAGWGATTAGTTNSDGVSFSSTSLPTSGLTYTWTPVYCSGMPTAGTVAPASMTVCSGYPVTLTASGYTVLSGITLQWQSSTDNISFTDIPGATTNTYTSGVIASNMFFRLKVVCGGTSTSYTTSVPVTISNPTPTVAILPVIESFENWINGCFTTDRPGVSWLTNPGTTDSAWRRNDQQASANWTLGTSGGYTPLFTAGAASARFHSFYVTAGNQGSMSLYANLSAAGSKSISFDYINTSGSDSLFVEVSTNGGTTWTVLGGKGIAAAWTPVSFLTSATAANAIIRFRAKSDYGATDIGMDNLNVMLNTCAAPTSPTVTALTSTSATLGWTSAGTQWQVEYGTGAFGTGTRSVTSSNPLVLSSLTPGSAYNYYVRRICGAGDTSLWTAATPFMTPLNCAAATAISGCGASQTFTNVGNGIYDPVVMVGSVNAPYGTPGREMIYQFTPTMTGVHKLNVSAVTNTSYVDYFYKPVSGGCGNTGWTFINDLNSVSSADTFSMIAGTAYYIMLDPEVATAVGQTFSIVCPPTCIAPTALTTTAMTQTGATLGWTQSGTPGQWQIQHGNSSFTLGTGTNVLTTTNPYTLGGLSAGTGYSYFVRAICSPGDTSAWSGPYIFNTVCANASLPFAENFVNYPSSVCASEGTGSLGASTTLTGTSSNWTSDDWLNVPGNTATKLNIYNNTFTAIRDWMITPTIDFGTGGNKVLEFNMGMVKWNTTTPDTIGSDDTLAVVISTNNGASWSMANAVKVFTAANPPSGANGSERYYIPLNGYSGLVKIGFYGSQGNIADTKDVDVMIDSVLITNCTLPTAALGNDTALCPGNVMTLSSGTGTEYTWNTGATTQSINVSTAGTYWLKTINGSRGCYTTDTVVISNGVTPVVNLGNDTTVCSNAQFMLDAGANTGYVWSTGATTQTVPVTTTGNYYVRVTNNTACTATDTVMVTVNHVASVGLITPTVTMPSVAFTSDAANATTYAWDFGDSGTDATASPTHAYTANGTYTVRLIVTNACGSDTAVTTVQITGVGVNTPLAANAIKLYPNPAINKVIVESGNTIMTSYSLFNNVGALVKESHVMNAHKESIDLSLLPAGMYQLRVTTDNGSQNYKVQIIK